MSVSNLLALLIAACLLTACQRDAEVTETSSAAEQPAKPAKPEPAPPDPVQATSSDAAPKPAGVLLVASEDMDGDGAAEAVRVSAEGVRVGDSAIQFDRETQKSIASSVEHGAEIVDFNPKKPGKQLYVWTHHVEDSMEATIYVYAGGTLESAGYVGGTSVRVRDGLLRSEYIQCGQNIVRHWALRNGKLVKIVDKKTGTYNESECMACPFVYVQRGSDWIYVGEILRELRDPSLEAHQSLAIPRWAARERVLRVRLAEEKRETTYLDQIYLDVNGHRVAPSGCAQADAWCTEDRARHVLRTGDLLDLEFEIPEGVTNDLTLWALGYYTPIP